MAGAALVCIVSGTPDQSLRREYFKMANGMVQSIYRKRIEGLDSIRFICALVVVLFHCGVVPRGTLGTNTFDYLIGAALRSFFNGPAAVIIFFLISGFCIHFPFRDGAPVDLWSFYSRRLIRICGPALSALVVWKWIGVRDGIDDPGIFWSIICEAEYYLLYPLLLRLRLRIGWWPLIAGAGLVAYILAFSQVPAIERAAGGYPAFGYLNWLIGLPCWLMGCSLAESFGRFPQPLTIQIWLSRILVFATSAVLLIIKSHAKSIYLSNPFILNLFGVVGYFWLGLEIAYRREVSAPAFLEWAGKWSYSLYLMHPAAIRLVTLQPWLHPVVSSHWRNLFFVLCSLPIAYAFHLAAESPLHRLAITATRRLKSRVLTPT
ncbi:MAG TPA: acyltransferase family protein [Chthoniobacterales bacterium]